MPQDEDLVPDVWGELKDLRTRGIGRLNEPKRPNIKVLFLPRLEEAARTIPGYHLNLTRMARINLLLKHEVARIEALAVREQLILSFGLRDDLDNTDTAKLRMLAATLVGDSDTNYSRSGGTETSNLWTLAVQIVADCFSDSSDNQAIGSGVEVKALPEGATVRERASTLRHSPAVRSAPGVIARQTWHERMPRWSNPYVPRHAYHDEISGFLTSRRRALLVGLPGMGKTRLACEVAVALAEAIGSEVIQLQGGTENAMLLSMQSELNRRGVGVTDDQRIIHEFAALAEVTEPPLVIVVDNLGDASVIRRVFPPSVHAMILVTARSRVLDEASWPSVEIEKMSVDEAVSLASAQLPPDVPAEDVRRLAGALGCYPLAIVHAAPLLGKGGPFTIDQFCRELDRNAGRVLGDMTGNDQASSNEQTLTFIYRTFLSHLERTFMQAADLLKATALLRQTQTPQTLLQSIFEELPRYRKTAPDDYDGIAFGFARRRLESYVLVSGTADELAVHQLVQALIRSLIRGKDDSAVDATVDGLNRWLRQTAVDESDITPWLTTIFSLVDTAQGRSLPPGAIISLGDLLGWAMAAAFAADDHQGLAKTRQTWLYQWIISESGADDEAIAGVQYIWLDGSDSEYAPTALARLPKRDQAIERLSSSRKVVLTGALNWTDTREQTIRIPLPNGSVRLVQPIDQAQDVLRHMLSGDNREARRRAHSLTYGTASAETVIEMQLRLAAMAIREGDLPLADQPVRMAKELLFARDSEGTPIQMGRLFQLEGDIAHRQYLDGRHAAAGVKQLYEEAREKYRCEAIPLGRLETERKLACLLAHASGDRASARLWTLLHRAEAPLYGPIQHRIRLSLAKIALLRGRTSIADYDHYESCWSAAEFYATSSVSDRYWYVESLVTAYIVGNKCDAPEGELSLLFEAITREAPLIGRHDKVDFVAKARSGMADVTHLLAD